MHTQQQQKKFFWILVTLVIAEMSSGFEAAMIYAAVGAMYREYGSPIAVGWVITSFILVSAAACAICSRLGDMYGRRRVLLAVLGLAAIGSLVSALLPTYTGIMVGRCLQGFSAAILPLCYGLAREHLPPARVPMAIGMVATTALVSAGLGLVCGGYLVDNYSWHWVFYVSFIMAVVTMPLVLAVIPVTPQKSYDKPVDILGGILFVPAVLGILIGISNGKYWGWADARTLGMMIGGAVLLVVWVIYELRHENPLIDVRLMANRQIALAYVISMFQAFGANQMIQVLSMLFQQPAWTGVGLGLSATLAGLVQFPFLIAALIGGPLAGKLAPLRGARFTLLLAAPLMATGWAILTLKHDSVWFLFGLMFVLGIFYVMISASIPMLIVESVPAERTSEATGLAQMLRLTFAAAGSQVAVVLLATSTVADPSRGPASYPTGDAFALTFSAITLMCVVCFLAALALPRRQESKVVAGGDAAKLRAAGSSPP